MTRKEQRFKEEGVNNRSDVAVRSRKDPDVSLGISKTAGGIREDSVGWWEPKPGMRSKEIDRVDHFLLKLLRRREAQPKLELERSRAEEGGWERREDGREGP